MEIATIVIPAAGFGTRFLPFTKTVPKELLPLLNKPALQNVVEEGVLSGIHNFCIIVKFVIYYDTFLRVLWASLADASLASPFDWINSNSIN